MLYWPPCLWTFALVCHSFRTCALCFCCWLPCLWTFALGVFVIVMINGVFCNCPQFVVCSMQEDASTWHYWAANQKASLSSGRGAQRSSDLGPSMDGFRGCSGFRMGPASGSNQLHGAPQSSHADCTADSTALACMVHHRAHMQIAQESSHAEHRNVAFVQGPQAKDCAKALGQPHLPIALA